MPEVTNLLLNLTTSLEVKRNEYLEQPSFETETKFLRTSSTYKQSSKTRVLLKYNYEIHYSLLD